MLCFQVRVVLKYRHCDGNLCIKVTDDAVVSDAREIFPFGCFHDILSLKNFTVLIIENSFCYQLVVDQLFSGYCVVIRLM